MSVVQRQDAAGPPDGSPSQARRRERIINAPGVVSLLILVLIGAHAARVLAGASLEPFAATRDDLVHHVWIQFLTYQFVHGSWAHVLGNAAFVLAFGAPVARFLGPGLRGAATFVLFFLVCGFIAGVGYGFYADVLAQLLGRGVRAWGLVGASGAASGLMGAAARLIQGHGRLGPLRGRVVVGMSVGWIAINILLGASGLTPGAGAIPVAWEAHIIGYFAGLFLIGAFGRLAGHPRFARLG